MRRSLSPSKFRKRPRLDRADDQGGGRLVAGVPQQADHSAYAGAPATAPLGFLVATGITGAASPPPMGQGGAVKREPAPRTVCRLSMSISRAATTPASARSGRAPRPPPTSSSNSGPNDGSQHTGLAASPPGSEQRQDDLWSETVLRAAGCVQCTAVRALVWTAGRSPEQVTQVFSAGWPGPAGSVARRGWRWPSRRVRNAGT